MTAGRVVVVEQTNKAMGLWRWRLYVDGRQVDQGSLCEPYEAEKRGRYVAKHLNARVVVKRPREVRAA